ncbi:WD repeat-containing protein 26-like, partial [Trifolium pratense]
VLILSRHLHLNLKLLSLHNLPDHTMKITMFRSQQFVRTVVITFDGRNMFACISRGKRKIGYNIGDKKQPEKKGADFDTSDAENSMVVTWLVNSMIKDISANSLCYATPKDLWDNVSQTYSDLENQSQEYEITLQLGKIRQGEDSVTKYFNCLK